ncbi:MAG: HEPN domain-containing protein [Lachnospiraceae bacterium]|nr:HEPN domain-containing protein [Lachnospiraceae bacterium]
MALDTASLSRYRLDRAKEDLTAAISNHKEGLFKASINRSYYAIFHCIRAVNITKGFDSSKHAQVIAYFNRYFVHTGEFARNTYKLIDKAYRIRERCDYQDFFLASREDSEAQIECAKEFIRVSEEYLNKKLEIQTGSSSGTEMTDAKSGQKQDTTESNS